ncbi:MAG: hypothetical protein GWN29_06875, partial [Gammaproteobacteria bacterium]|nr:hypothetical protein [Gammaproteobacteria bacterium]
GLGVFLIGLFYFADLMTMLVLPSLLGTQQAMDAMLYLHLDVRWIVSLLSLVLIFAGFIGVIRERKETNELLQHAQRREIVGQLASGVAHDFNNTITVIAGNAEMALKNLSESDPARAELEEIVHACDQACNVTRQLLTFSQSESHEPERLDLSELVRRAEPMLRRAVGEDVRLHLSLAKTFGAVEADPGKIEQALLNLVINARDAITEDGEIVVAVEKASSDGNPSAVIRVSDNGC